MTNFDSLRAVLASTGVPADKISEIIAIEQQKVIAAEGAKKIERTLKGLEQRAYVLEGTDTIVLPKKSYSLKELQAVTARLAVISDRLPRKEGRSFTAQE